MARFYFAFHQWFKREFLNNVRDSRTFGIMINEYTDISITCHLIVFAYFIKEGLPLCIFLVLLHLEDRKKDACIIFTTLKKYM